MLHHVKRWKNERTNERVASRAHTLFLLLHGSDSQHDTSRSGSINACRIAVLLRFGDFFSRFFLVTALEVLCSFCNGNRAGTGIGQACPTGCCFHREGRANGGGCFAGGFAQSQMVTGLVDSRRERLLLLSAHYSLQ